MRLFAAIALIGSIALAQQDAPTTQDTPSGRHLIDQEILAKWKEAGVKPSGRAEDAEFLRRVGYEIEPFSGRSVVVHTVPNPHPRFDAARCLQELVADLAGGRFGGWANRLELAGTIPSLEEAEKFLADRAMYKRSKVIDELLASERHHEYWGWVWANTVVGHESDRSDQAITAVFKDFKEMFAKNAPLDEIARTVITATGKTETDGKGKKDDMMMEDGANGFPLFYFAVQRTAGRDFPLILANKFSKTFLGTQISCAQCHDHPFDKWTQEDFYGMAAFFTEVYVKRLQEGDKTYGYEVGDRAGRGGKRASGPLMVPGTQKRIGPSWLDTKEAPKGDKTLREEFVRMLTSRSNTQFARAGVNRVWAYLMGRGIVNPPDDFNGKNKPSHPQLMEALAADFAAHKYDVRWLIKEICNSQAYQQSSRTKERTTEMEKLYAVGAVRALAPEQIINSLLTAGLTDPSKITFQQRGQMLRQFRFAFPDDEGTELNEFQGTIAGALMMMNGDVIAQATGSAPQGKRPMERPAKRPAMKGNAATRLGSILQNSRGDDERLRAVFIAVLTRPPSAKEAQRYMSHVRGAGEDGFEDVMWALLNCSEFMFQH